MKRNYLLFILFSSSFASAVEIPVLGDGKAENHQICGNHINVQIRKTNKNHLIIGLINNKTDKMDLFESQNSATEDMAFSKFSPVHFDNLSKNFIADDQSEIDIVWGSSVNEKKEISYSLALGPEAYRCGLLQKWPNDKANILYGETK